MKVNPSDIFSNNPIFNLFADELDTISNNERAMIILGHGYIELIINVILESKYKNSNTIIDANYFKKIKKLLSDQLIDQTVFEALNWFRLLRNKAVHNFIFSFSVKTRKKMWKFIEYMAPSQKMYGKLLLKLDLKVFIYCITGILLNKFSDIFLPLFKNFMIPFDIKDPAPSSG